MWKQGEEGHVQTKETGSKETSLQTLWSWSYSFQDCENIDFYCLCKKEKKKLSHRSSSTSSTKIVSRGFSSDAYSKFKFFLTGIILQNAVCEIINMLCEFVLLSWEQCKIDSIRTPVFQRHKLAAVNPKSCVSITAPGERKIDRDFPKFNTDLETLHIIKIESRS